jgi:hypothetical protein
MMPHLPTLPADACRECRALAARPQLAAAGGSWMRDRFPTWDNTAHLLFRGPLNQAVDVVPIWDAPCGAFFREVVPA